MTKAFLFFLLETLSFKTAGRPSVLAFAVFPSIQKTATQRVIEVFLRARFKSQQA